MQRTTSGMNACMQGGREEEAEFERLNFFQHYIYAIARRKGEEEGRTQSTYSKK